MQQNYCFRCGSFTHVDDVTKLCDLCYQRWARTGQPA
jgi:hypothetical protein